MRRIIITEEQVKFVVDKMIQEQIGFQKQDDVNVVISTKDPKIAKNFANRTLTSMFTAVGLQWDPKTKQPLPNPELDKTVSQMKGLMDESSAQIFDSMKQLNPNFYW